MKIKLVMSGYRELKQCQILKYCTALNNLHYAVEIYFYELCFMPWEHVVGSITGVTRDGKYRMFLLLTSIMASERSSSPASCIYYIFPLKPHLQAVIFPDDIN
ncbi:hypothetical protein XELAEV_18022735mg [Xenopus laevis]|uniref:Uncharacterized protein n=1 Tax=Xenopus laevis TaxID=8355 RepID=A0A974D5G0_XENLA|nr:hypothetical protein XELAEV_18022735mg [Xenopus laevis]